MAVRPRLGQHFLRDGRALERIAQAAVAAGDAVVEIGPGKGALTRRLLPVASRVVAVEIDHALAVALPARCGHPANLDVVQADILAADLRALAAAAGDRAVITGNLPYYATSPILRSVFGAGGAFRTATFLMQDEVADRTVAGPGSRAYGYLSCLCALHSEPRKLFRIGPGAFVPRPQVHSAVVRFELHGEPPPAGLAKFLQACFRAPRKTLRNNLAGLYPEGRLDRDPDAGRRAQQLTLPELTALWRRVEAVG